MPIDEESFFVDLFGLVLFQRLTFWRNRMRIAKNDVPVKIDAPGAIARQKTEFGDATGYAG